MKVNSAQWGTLSFFYRTEELSPDVKVIGRKLQKLTSLYREQESQYEMAYEFISKKGEIFISKIELGDHPNIEQ